MQTLRPAKFEKNGQLQEKWQCFFTENPSHQASNACFMPQKMLLRTLKSAKFSDFFCRFLQNDLLLRRYQGCTAI